jgi:hypothetical protein
VANVYFDDQALQVLGFQANIYHLLGNLGWVQFSNGLGQTPTRSWPCKFL